MYVHTMIELEQAVVDTIAAEVEKMTVEELIVAMQRNTLADATMGVTVPGSGCKFCLPQRNDLGRENESEFTCDLKGCIEHSLTYHLLGILQDASSGGDVTNVATTRNRLINVLQTVFSEQNAKQVASNLINILETTDAQPVNDSWAD